MISIAYITTSRKPGVNLRSFTKEISRTFGLIHMTRGKSSLSDIVSNIRYEGGTKIFIVTEKKGNPYQILELDIGPKSWEIVDTYFVKLHKLRKTLTDSREKINSIRNNTKSRPMLHFLKGSRTYVDDESEYVLEEAAEVFTVYFGKDEIGPRFELFYRA